MIFLEIQSGIFSSVWRTKTFKNITNKKFKYEKNRVVPTMIILFNYFNILIIISEDIIWKYVQIILHDVYIILSDVHRFFM